MSWEDATPEELNRLHKAIMLAPDLATLEALLEGQTVPDENFDPKWLAAYGLKKNPE